MASNLILISINGVNFLKIREKTNYYQKNILELFSIDIVILFLIESINFQEI